MPKSATVVLIRHGEKPDDPNDPMLVPAGEARAHAYVAHFKYWPEKPPAALIAAADSPHSNRSRLTLEPLAAATGMHIDSSVADADFATLAARLRAASSGHDGITTLICWHHGQLLDLAKALGASASALPAKWPDDEFGWTVRIDYDANGAVAHTSCSSQRLMFDDTRVPGQAMA